MATAAQLDTNDLGSFADKATADAMVAKAKALRPLLMAEAAAGEAQRSPTKAVENALFDANILSAMLPKRLGGVGLSFTDFCRMQIEIAKGDPAISWVVQIINGTSWVTSLAPDSVQDAVFGNGPAAVCGAYNPPGKARKVDGGWIINGAWPYTSGSRQSTWAQQGVVLEGYEGPVVPGISMCYIPFTDLTITDTWYVTGMQGTGSDTSVAKDVFIPEGQMVLMDERAGRAIANEYGIHVAGTAAVIGFAKRHGLIESARACFERLHDSDFRISKEVIQTVLRNVGEL